MKRWLDWRGLSVGDWVVFVSAILYFVGRIAGLDGLIGLCVMVQVSIWLWRGATRADRAIERRRERR